tara:strand:- start:1512 stop:2108 length:597 start_codon:yes stop_codon:yes gene_type:complete
MHKLIPLRALRQSPPKYGIIPSDIPKIDSINKITHSPNSNSPESVKHVTRPWYKHQTQDDNLLILQGTRYVDLYESTGHTKASFIITPDKVYKDDKLYYDGPAILGWRAGVFHRITSGEEGSISINFVTQTNLEGDFKNFNIYDLDVETGKFNSIKNENMDSPHSVTDMYTQQYFEDYKQFKREAAAERRARATDYFN